MTTPAIPHPVLVRLRSSPSAASSGEAELRRVLAAVARHDEQAFTRLYAQVHRPVYGMAKAVLGDHHLAEDTTNDVLAEVWTTAAARYVPERGQVLAWLMTIARRRAIDRVRSVQAARDREQAYAQLCEQVLPEQRRSPEDDIERTQTTGQLRHALAGLPEQQRDPLLLAYLAGHTRSRIAVELGIPRGTVTTRITAALRALRDQLTDR
ncbi:sigma-70 family RNA polymerase sigma factor [Amycolatopsis sp. H20-H5]|uniref:sigma-70 family RNA polymerase sigma factor n=1 Tax=Amycolatopsis sp. H20-H5 TaxID=3046309 RepID=UPI002DBEDBF4|nr:sigma-70 family RNA polymerase sigma factor [Amycolatopsis sp. H20-H5]MEC3982574.1 sigma-70 family RNA polymerase sigma factor [Amycolatopsis sp. H20-H5]